MFDIDASNAEQKVIKFSQWVRIILIVKLVIVGLEVLIHILGVSLFGAIISEFGKNIDTNAGFVIFSFFAAIIFVVSVISAAILIAFIIYYGKTIKRTEDYSYISAIPAMIHLVLVILQLIATIKAAINGNIYSIIFVIINLFIAYLVFTVYSGLHIIKKEQLFG